MVAGSKRAPFAAISSVLCRYLGSRWRLELLHGYYLEKDGTMAYYGHAGFLVSTVGSRVEGFGFGIQACRL